jgi:hypothetical protein
MNNKGFAIIEFLAIGMFILILVICFGGFFYQASKPCVEYEEVPVTDCYKWGYHTTCENRMELRCIRYE